MRPFELRFVQLAEPEVGVWCPRCALPSGITFTFVIECEQSSYYPQVMQLGECVDCHGSLGDAS